MKHDVFMYRKTLYLEGFLFTKKMRLIILEQEALGLSARRTSRRFVLDQINDF